MNVISIGEVLWDVFDGQEMLGGAPLNFSASLHRLGHSVSLFTGIGMDERGERVLRRMTELELSTSFVQRNRSRDTGTAIVMLDSNGKATFTIPRPAAYDSLNFNPGLLDRIKNLQGDWLYFGTLAQMDPSNFELLTDLFRCLSGIRGFYDMNLREGHWNLQLVQQLSALAAVMKLNDEEAELLFKHEYPLDTFSLKTFCERWSSRYGIETICVTLGSQGCAVFIGGSLQLFPGYRIQVADTVGAGDAFAAGFLHALTQPWPLESKAAFANALGAVVAARAGATPPWTIADCQQLMAAKNPVTIS